MSNDDFVISTTTFWSWGSVVAQRVQGFGEPLERFDAHDVAALKKAANSIFMPLAASNL